MKLSQMFKEGMIVKFKFCAVFLTAACLLLSMFGCASNTPQTVEELHQTQDIGMTSIDNARQLGGYETEDGRQVKDDVLLRSGKLSEASKDDIDRLKSVYNLRTVISFCSEQEQNTNPDPIIEGVENITIDLSDADAAAAAVLGGDLSDMDFLIDSIVKYHEQTKESNDDTPLLFKSEVMQDGMQRFFDCLITQEEGAVLFHCTAGKDRTGLAAALVLSALGVPEETVFLDYELSNVYREKQIDYIMQYAEQKIDDEETLSAIRGLIGVDRTYLETIYSYANEHYGSMLEFIKSELGLNDEDIELLRERYLE